MPVQRNLFYCRNAIMGMVLLLWSQGVLAQEAVTASPGNEIHSHSAGLQFGQVWVTGDFVEEALSTTAPGLFYEYRASDVFALKIDLKWISLKQGLHNDRLSIFSSTAGIRANLVYYDKLVPYAAFGVGLYFVDKSTPDSPGEDLSTSNFGVNLTLGSDLNLSDRAFVGLALTLHQLFSDTATLPNDTKTDVSGRWSSFLLRAGMRF